jgi:alkanesulfonate monooxygenase SsuD/methylene tetrahydromethanopterin reductase-like flavin-dependent oxidoreductase (luciferase family)
MIEVMRRLWRGNDVSFEGSFSRFEHITLEPKPVQPGGVPIWLASNDVEPGLRRVGRMGDGWLNNIIEPAVYRICLEKIRNYAQEAGREPSAIQPGLYFTCAAGGEKAIDEGRAFLAQYYNRPYEKVAKAMLCVMASWDAVIDSIEVYRDAGARVIVVRFATRDQMGHLEGFAEALSRRKLLAQSV